MTTDLAFLLNDPDTIVNAVSLLAALVLLAIGLAAACS